MPRTYTPEQKAARVIYIREFAARSRDEVFDAYGGVCICCGEGDRIFLAIDHIDPILREGRVYRMRGTSLYGWLKSHNYPKNYQILCNNCNQAKRQAQVCPHEEARLARPWAI